MYCWSLAWRILSITLLTWDDCNCAVVWAFFGIAFLMTGMKTDLFQSCGHCWVFQFCWHIESSTFTASSFRIWNSSTGIPSSPRALFIVMLSKAHLTLHSRMSGSRWVITSSWWSGSWRFFLYVNYSSITSWEIYGETMETVLDFIFGGAPKSLQMMIEAMKLKDAYSLEERLWPI